MTPDDVMAAAMDRSGLTREAIVTRARTEADALDALVAWRRAERQGEGGERWWVHLYRLRDVADRLIEDADGIRNTIRGAEAIVTGECLCNPFNACERCGDEVTP